MAVDLGFEYDLARFIDFRDGVECDRVRRIPRTELTQHVNPDFRIAVADDPAEFYRSFAADLVDRIWRHPKSLGVGRVTSGARRGRRVP